MVCLVYQVLQAEPFLCFCGTHYYVAIRLYIIFVALSKLVFIVAKETSKKCCFGLDFAKSHKTLSPLSHTLSLTTKYFFLNLH